MIRIERATTRDAEEPAAAWKGLPGTTRWIGMPSG
jgi:hypothetical protein